MSPAEKHVEPKIIMLRKISDSEEQISHFSHMKKQNLERKRVGDIEGRPLAGENHR